MSTCKENCLCYSVCTKFEAYAHNPKLNLPNPSECSFFKDRSKFIELPCNVGDTVYIVTGRTKKIGQKKILKHIIVECGVDNFRIGDLGYPSAALCDKDNNWWYGIEPSDFGNLVFLTREEAEQVLKEC
jgi:hypothetical protein